MSLMPEFQIGVWNAWILTLFLFLFMMLTGVLPKDMIKKMTPVEETRKIRKFMFAVFYVMLLYSVFLPLKLGTAWFIVGLAIYIFGFIIAIAAIVNIAAAKPGEPFTKGMYRYSRHPLFLSTLISMAGAGIASASWLFLLLFVMMTVFTRFTVLIEEQVTTQKFGDAYKRYMAKTPRWIGLPK